MHADPDTLVERPADLTADWLAAALGTGPIAEFTYDRIGTGQMSECYRVVLSYGEGGSGPASVVLKVAAADPSSRQTGLAMGLYQREVRFYTDVAPRVLGPVARCHHAAYDATTGVFDLLLDDAAPATVGDEIYGATPEQATLALSQLGRVHGPLLGDGTLGATDWLTQSAGVDQGLVAALYAGYVDRYRDRLAPEHVTVCERMVETFDAYMAAEAESGRPQGLIHGDFRLDNMLFGQPGADRPLTVVDWQTVTWGPAFTDVAYFLGCALPVERRREHYDELLRAYHAALGPEAAVTVDDVREGVRHQSFFGVLMAIVSPMLVARTDRGDEMFMAMMARNAQHVLDTDALAILPAPTVPEPLQPNADDEGAHPPTDEALWSESWYFDFVDPSQRLGGWIRLGLMPNEGRAWINALLCGPDMPTVAILEWDAALPDSHTDVRTDDVDLRLQATEPLRSYRVSLRGAGRAYDDPGDLLTSAADAGRPVDVTMDLVWTTVGVPYQYRITTRYEIACTVSGTVTVDGRTFDVIDVVGQRDHSWAVRDWWGMDWVWSALHLDDGTRVHAVEMRIPDLPRFGIGYVQRPGEPLLEVQKVTAQETFGADGLPVGTRLEVAPGDVAATIEVAAHAPVALVSADGKVSHFPRAWVTVATDDGRTGVGWMEWNRVQP